MRVTLADAGVAAGEAERIDQDIAARVEQAIAAARADALPAFEDAARDVYTPREATP
jgi:pyruvate dehydrogenase E1 component alpha subunit